MNFENPVALWLLLTLPILLIGISIWAWKARKEAAAPFLMDLKRLKRKHLEKYALVGIIMVLLSLTLALPQVAFSASATSEKSGEIALLVDVSRSMAAQKALYSSTRLDRVKPILDEIIASVEDYEQVKISLLGFTSVARSLVPFVGKEDYSYLRESIKKVLDINSAPLRDTSLGQAIIDVTDNFSKGNDAKIIVMISDGEPFYWSHTGMTDNETRAIQQGVLKAAERGVKIITVGVGEIEGAKFPIYDTDGKFTGQYEKLLGEDYVSSLEEDTLKQIAAQGGGEYFYESNRDGLTKLIADTLNSVNPQGAGNDVMIYRSVAQWFLLAALPFWVVFAKRHLLG